MSDRWGARRRRLLVVASAVVAGSFVPSAAPATEPVMSTAAGGGEGYEGDGGPAVEAGLAGPRMIAFDGHGGYYIADTYHHVIRHVDAAGVISTYAGTGQAGYSGDHGPATEARFNAPHSVAVDGDGNVIVGDPVNDRIRRIDARTKTVTTIAGTGEQGYSGDGGPANLARLSDSKVAIVGPDRAIYIADYGNSVIRRVDPDSGRISTFAGNGKKGAGGDGGPAREASFAPRNIAFDIDGDLLVADRETNTIRSIDADTGIITTIAGSGAEGPDGDGGPALEAELARPRGLGVDWMGNVYIADSVNNRVRKVDADTGVITTVAGTGKSGRKGDGNHPTEADLQNPRHVAFDDNGDMYIVDTGSSRVRWVQAFLPARPTGPPPPGSGTGDGDGPAGEPTDHDPQAGGGAPRSGYWMLAGDGGVFGFGDAGDHGRPSFAGAGAVDIEPTPSGGGYWVVDSSGTVSPHGDAAASGPEPEHARLGPDEKVTSLSATPTGSGYWLFTDHGRALPVGDAAHFGDLSEMRLNGPVLDSVPTPSGAGYYMVASDGGVFAFGDALFFGSMGSVPLNAPVRSLVPDPDGTGYWLVASDGGVFAFDAPFGGSMGTTPLNRGVSGMVAFGQGYLMVAEDGGVFNFSQKPFHGSLGDAPPTAPVVAIAALG